MSIVRCMMVRLAVGFVCVGTLAVALAGLGQAGSSHFADFRDIAAAAGLTGKNVYGGMRKKDFILETTGNGVAIFDYDGDGRNDVLVANGTRLKPGPGETSSLQLYHNDRRGHF